ncbi:MAG: HAMP domain-containing histidine kinase [Bacteroidaceae bacterium]|nr:HAMP domain-containing histidine kinase [Bacteroidaceae bacterium]
MQKKGRKMLMMASAELSHLLAADFKVSERTVNSALRFDPKHGMSSKCRLLRRAALERGATLMVEVPNASKLEEAPSDIDLKKLFFDTDNEINDFEVNKKENELTHAFIANISHEIRTPLNAIQGFSQLIAETANSAESKKYAEEVIRNTEQLLNLFREVIELSSFDSGTRKINRIKCDFEALLSDWEYDTKMQLVNDAINVYIERPAPFKYNIESDPKALTEVILYLVNNALKFTEKGSITIGYRPIENNEIYFFVRDTGCGIPAEKQKEIFARFVKLDHFKSGPGLGLSICQNIIQALNGKIGVKSKEGKGSEFWFTLPYKK